MSTNKDILEEIGARHAELVRERNANKTPEQRSADEVAIMIRDLWGEMFNVVRKHAPQLKHFDQAVDDDKGDTRYVWIEKGKAFQVIVKEIPIESLDGDEEGVRLFKMEHGWWHIEKSCSGKT